MPVKMLFLRMKFIASTHLYTRLLPGTGYVSNLFLMKSKRPLTQIHNQINFIINIITFKNLNTPRIPIHHKNGENKLGISNLIEIEIKLKMERIETDEQILDAIMNPEMPFEKIQSAVALEKEAKRNTAEQEAAFDSEKLEKYKKMDFITFAFDGYIDFGDGYWSGINVDDNEKRHQHNYSTTKILKLSSSRFLTM